MTTVFIALGSNLGDRSENLELGLRHLSAQVKILDRSPIYETRPWGVADQPDFLNMAVEGETDLEPLPLIRFLQGVERAIGRTPGIRYGPRVIDLDILFFDEAVLCDDDLIIPHPRLADRRFVLIPLTDIAPNWVHPVLGATMRELLSRLPDDGSVKLYGPPSQ